MDTASGRASLTGRRALRIARSIIIVSAAMAAGAVSGVALGGLLPPGSEALISAPFRW